MTPIELVEIQRFMALVKRAAQSRSRDIRLDITDATVLIAEIGGLLSRLAAYEVQPAPTSRTAMDGGSFN